MSNKEQNPAIEQNGLLAALPRPKKASEALELLSNGVDIEVPNNKVFDFFRYIEVEVGNLRLNCGFNKLNQGFTVMSRH